MSAKSVIEAASGAYRCIFGEEMPDSLVEGISADSRCTYCHEYYTGDARELCHAAKDGDIDAIMRMAREMCRYVSPEDILVPVPSHTGRATMTLELAKQIAWNSGARVEDVLVGSSRKSLYELKKEGVEVPEGFFGLRLVRPVEGRIWLVDNVVATGSTAREALKLLPGAHVLAYAMDTGKYRTMTESYTDDIAAVARRIKGGEEPNFTHHRYMLNKWMVHYSPDAYTVAQDGFRYARHPGDEMSVSLETDPESPDYLKNVGIDGNIVFAFPMADEFDDPHYVAYDGSPSCTGRGAAVFVGSGEYVNSAFEQEDQVIVDKRTVHGALYVNERGDVFGSPRRPGDSGRIRRGLPGDTYKEGFRWIADNQEKAIDRMFQWDNLGTVPSVNPI